MKNSRTISPAKISATARRLTRSASRQASDLAEAGKERWEEVAQLPDDLRAHYRQHVEPRARRASIGVLEIAQAVLAVGVAVPRLVAQALTIARVLTERAEVVQQRGHALSERARELAHAVPPSTRQVRTRRWKVAGWLTLGFTGGFVAGWIACDARGLAARARDEEQALRHAQVVALNDSGRRDATIADDRHEAGSSGDRVVGRGAVPVDDEAAGIAGDHPLLRATSSDGG